MIEFLQSLLDQGFAVVKLAPADPATPDELAEVLEEFDQRQRSSLAYDAPALDLPTATWAAGILYQLIHLLAARDVDVAGMEASLAEPCPAPRSASVDYSVDLLFQHLPEVARFAARMAPDDPLVSRIKTLGAAWPLSSVGMMLESCNGVKPIVTHPCLLALYTDRILRTADLARLEEPAVRQAAEDTVGAYPDLCPKVAQHLHLPLMDVPL
ncbi:hypothetical protein [Verrucomicrobium sp. BvORR106]|uniref:hypothetical protein n=1 Tax=Verrucomicrobium sp. BvORR106 TaxID=1403819 RepID=UPI00056E674B|nr:hypothetical protein [Verrucomicrobium sp. BvORR106]